MGKPISITMTRITVTYKSRLKFHAKILSKVEFKNFRLVYIKFDWRAF